MSDQENLLKFYFNQWESLNPPCSKKENQSDKEKVIDENKNKILSQRKPSLPVFQISNNKVNNSIYNSKTNQLNNARKSMFQYSRSCSTNNLHIVNKDTKNTCVYVDFPNTPFYDDSKLFNLSDEENHTYENFLLKPDNSNSDTISDGNTYLELKCPILLDECQSVPISKSNFEMNNKNLERLQMPPEEEASIIFQKSDHSHKLSTNPIDKQIDQQPLSKSDLNDIKLSNDSGISSVLLTNQRNSLNLVSSNSNDKIHSTESTDSKYSSDKISEKDFLQNKISISQENSKSIKSVQTEEEKQALYKEISKQITLRSYTIKEIIQFHFHDGTFSRRVIEESQSASSVCDNLKNHLSINLNTHWQLFECIEKESLERPIEDHENIYNIYKSWGNSFYRNKFIFKENRNMFKIFLKSNVFTNQMESNFQIKDHIWVKEPHTKWKKAYTSVSESTIYFNTKPDSKDHMDKYALANLQKFDFFTCTDNDLLKKNFKAPTNEIIIFKQRNLEQKSQDLPCICVFSNSQKEMWLESLKIAKYTFNQLKKNYLEFEKKSEKYNRIQSYYPKNSNSSVINFNPSSV